MKTFSKTAFTFLLLLTLSACQQNTINQPEPTPPENNSIQISQPQPNQKISSPLKIQGTATLWFFEAEFPITLVDSDGTKIATTQAVATEDWMTENPVPFSATLTFETNDTDGKIIFEKANPSGMADQDSSFELPVKF